MCTLHTSDYVPIVYMCTKTTVNKWQLCTNELYAFIIMDT